MKKSFILLLALCILLASGCSVQNTPGSEPTTPTTTPSQTPTPTTAPTPASAPDLEPETEYSYPLKEEDVRKILEKEFEGQPFEVRAVTRYVNDFLVEMGETMYTPVSLLYYVFGETGRTVQLTGTSVFTSYRVSGFGQVEYTTSGANAEVPRKGMPESGRARVIGDAYGMIDKNYAEVDRHESPMWLETTEPLYVGSWDTRTNEPYKTDRKSQLYDARIDTDGLSFSFIPNGNSREDYQSFFPAVTTCPSFDVFLDGDLFTIRMYNTTLESGGVSKEDSEGWHSNNPPPYPDYPYSFPEGSLGRDSHFVTDVEIHQDGDDAVVTCRLTEYAAKYQVETSNFGNDTIPYFRIIFRH